MTITTEQIVEAGKWKACEVYWNREEGSFTSDWMTFAVEAALTAMLPLIRKQLADEVRAEGARLTVGADPEMDTRIYDVFDVEDEWIRAARLIERVES